MFEIEIRKLEMKEIEKVLKLQESVHRQLEDKEVLQTLTEEEFKEIFSQGFIVGVFDGEQLIASRSMFIPPVDEPEHLADDSGIQDKESVIYSEISFIEPVYRGQKLQTRMGEYLIDEVTRDGRFKYCLTTVMPTNAASLKDKFKLGFKIMATKYKYNGKRRHILRLDLHQELKVTGEAVKVRYNDVEWSMAHGDDYIGDRFDGEFLYYYQKTEDLK